jgi:hypothetical protein
MTAVPVANVKAVKNRSKGVCEGCGLVPATEIHHRQYRSRGGTDAVSNLLHLCGWGNHTGCHGVAHTKAGEDKGWSVRSGFIPAERPAVLAIGIVLLDDAGEFEHFEGGELAEWRALGRFGATT